MSGSWISVEDTLPAHDQRVLGYIPGNKVFLPGKSLEFEVREVVVLRFCENFYLHNEEKASKHGVHFWAGEGNSNHYFSDVTHWMPVPDSPAG